MGHLLGYARVSTTDQHPQLQVDALERAGCYRVFTETASGARTDRPTLEQLLDQLRPGDTLVVWKLDRLGRSLRHLVDTVTGLAERGVGFRSLQEAIDTTTPGGPGDVCVRAVHGGGDRHDPGRQPGLDLPAPHRRQSLTNSSVPRARCWRGSHVP
jgi:DNA invertase Pin-like site-specific DNA recombinase